MLYLAARLSEVLGAAVPSTMSAGASCWTEESAFARTVASLSCIPDEDILPRVAVRTGLQISTGRRTSQRVLGSDP